MKKAGPAGTAYGWGRICVMENGGKVKCPRCGEEIAKACKRCEAEAEMYLLAW
jgi:predicted RNA-binding Zn-ribbon protein involved in translation (DUF1610 family)